MHLFGKKYPISKVGNKLYYYKLIIYNQIKIFLTLAYLIRYITYFQHNWITGLKVFVVHCYILTFFNLEVVNNNQSKITWKKLKNCLNWLIN